jgi:hypothetical protein
MGGMDSAQDALARAANAELVEAVVCAIPVGGVGAWAAAAEGLFPDP